jgi:hypothetical protein
MRQGASQILIAVVLVAALLGIVVLVSVRDYREGMILSSNREYMPSVRIDNTDIELPTPAPEAGAAATPEMPEAASPAPSPGAAP